MHIMPVQHEFSAFNTFHGNDKDVCSPCTESHHKWYAFNGYDKAAYKLCRKSHRCMPGHFWCNAFTRTDVYDTWRGEEECLDKDAYKLCLQDHSETNSFTRVYRCTSHQEEDANLPSIDNIIHILTEQRRKKDVVKSRCIYLDLCNDGLETHPVLANYLVPVLVECGNVIMAQQLFEKIVDPKEHAWTYMLRGYVDCNEPLLALDHFKKMQETQVHPSVHTYVYLFKACEILRDIETGRILHIEVVKKGHETDPFVSNCMMYMYIKCGSITDAERVFDQLMVQDLITLTAMMSGYVECGMSEEALKCYDRIQGDNIMPDSVMFICCLRACGVLGALSKGREIHADIIMEGLESSFSVTNTLIDMYLKCGSLVEAEQLSDEHVDRDLVSWTSLIRGYVENGFSEKAMECLEEAQLSGIIPDAVMYACCLKACCSIGAIETGIELHQEIIKKGLCTDQVVGNMLVDMYAKCNMLEESHEIFFTLPRRDVVSWTALIGGYAERGLHEDVRNYLRQMRLEGCAPNVATYICCLKGIGQVDTLSWGLEIHSQFVKEGYEKDTIIGSALVDMYAQCGSLLEAETVLNSLPVHTVFSWSALIAGYAENGATEMVLKCLEKMEEAGISSCAITLISCLKVCSTVGDLDSGYKMHTEIVNKGFERDVALGNALIGMYAKCGSLAASSAAFDNMSRRDVISWTTLMVAYAENGLREEASNCLGQMQIENVLPDSMSWNTVIEYHAIQGESDEALLLYICMQEQGTLPGSMTFANILQACGKTAALETGKRIHAQIHAQRGLETRDEFLCTVLIDMYGKCGSMIDAQEVFNAMSRTNLVQWNALITGYAHQGQSDCVFYCLHEMIANGVYPDEVTFVNILFICSHVGLVEKGRMYFEAMITESHINPTIRHLGCIVDLLGRVGQLDEAVLMLDKLDQPDLVAWNSVIGACQKLGDIEICEQAFESSLQLNEQGPTSFIMMANMYANFSF